MTFCLNIAVPTSMTDKVGWFMIILTTFNIFGNLSAVVFNSVTVTTKKYSLKKADKKVSIII